MLSHFINDISKGTTFHMLIEHLDSLFGDIPIFLLDCLFLVDIEFLINSVFKSFVS